MYLNKKIIAAAMLALVASACSKSADSGNSSSLFGGYDQTAMLNNIGNNILLAGINNLSSSAAAATTAINAFTANPTANTLTAAQTAWAALAQNWGSSAPFSFGPLNDNLIAANVDTWPANPAKIEAAVNSNANAASIGADTKGLKGLEYLLFDQNGNAAVLAKYTGIGAVNRSAFLNSVTQELTSQLTSLQSKWNSGYLNAFENAKGNDVSSSTSQVVNAISLYLDEVKNMKIGNPIGMGVKVNDNQPHPDLIEYKLAEQSLPVMKANVQAMKAAFDGGTGQGLDDLLNYTKAQKNGTNLSTLVDNQFDDVISKINLVNAPYATAVGTQKQQLQNVFSSLKTLIAYFKVDVANNLGVTITFSDTDGD
ncbi:putative lipoprotein [Pedobacter cryoconitis]|uniref:imelysin family protein n=1 Tax=Pedobacter cryoconitis TaxID=188932 RepID=UPI0016099EC0|nr:imelysin family protein [Pedobacter cryoconitis]MBB6270913.1 putative lipoprotein [Pedobacter cryoconitis]